MAVQIRPETPADRTAIEALHLAAFPTPAEAQLVNALRDGGWSSVSLVAELDGQVVGHALFHRLTWKRDQVELPAISLAPLTVLPRWQRQGIGAQLVRAGLAACQNAGERVVFVLGEPGYYGRFGFSAELAALLECPYASEAFQALELMPGALADARGAVIYPPPFAAL